MDPTRLKLGEWYGDHFVRLFHADARPGTVAQYLNTLAVWARLTGDPPIGAITPLVLADFRARCNGTPANVAKHCRHLNHLFSKLGPRGPRNRDALALVADPPWLRPPRTDKKKPRVPSDEEVAAFVRTAPIDLALFAVVAATTGSRNGAVRALTPETVDADGQLIRFPAHTDKKHEERIKPIPRLTLHWLQVHGPHMQRWHVVANAFSRRWNRAAAAIGSRLRPHGLKRWWGRQVRAAGGTHWCIRFALDHAQTDVTGSAYLDSFDELSGLVDKIPLPEEFRRRLHPDHQQTFW